MNKHSVLIYMFIVASYNRLVSKHSVGFTRQQNHRDREMGGGPFRESKNTFTSDFDKSSSSFSRAFRDRDERDGGRFSDRGGNRMFNKRFERDDRGSSRTSMFGKKFERDDRNREYKTESISQEKGMCDLFYLINKISFFT